jgi:urease gamma subunit
MNAEFYINLTRMKTLSNASFLESIKDIYLKSEQKAQFESTGTKEDDRGEVFFENGSVRCTRVSDGIIVEASATGTKNMYAVVGGVSKGTPLKDAITSGKAALDNDAVMEGIIDWMKRKPIQNTEVNTEEE